ncbi:hypothetical protein Hanom_Chr12g01098351 [Helianthus anomalus]
MGRVSSVFGRPRQLQCRYFVRIQSIINIKTTKYKINTNLIRFELVHVRR